MKRIITTLGAVLLIGLPFANASRLTPAKWHERQQQEAFRWAPKAKAASAEWQGLKDGSKVVSKAGPKTDSDVKMDISDSFEYLDMPDGTTWFVSVEYHRTVISQNEYYTSYDINGLTATVYNNKYEAVGLIEATFDKPDGMEICSSVQFGAAVTKKFFNTNDNYEIMIMANYKPIDAYGAIPFTSVYSLKGASTPADYVMTIPGYYTAAINSATDSWSENFFMEFFAGEEYTDDEIIYTFDIYGKASYSSQQPVKLQSFPINMIYTMSDGENESLPVLLNNKGNDLYVAVAKYEKTFFEDPFDYFSNKLSEDNHYQIDLYKKGAYEDGLSFVSTTSIPVENPSDGFDMRSYCLGAFEGIYDVNFDFNQDSSPAFVISVVDSDIHENTLPQFRVYNTAGSVIKEFGYAHEGFLRLSPVAGQPEQYCFLMSTGEGDYDYEFSFLNYPAMEKVTGIPLMLTYDAETFPLSLSLDRVAEGGSYNYAIATVNGFTDDEGNTAHRVAWFDPAGVFIQVDSLNGGKNVNYISPYISANGLGRYLMNTDDSREYLMYALRSEYEGSTQSHTELMIVNDRGEVLLQYAFDLQDSGINVAIVNEKTNPALWLSYYDFSDGQTRNEFISLPLNKLEGSGTPADPYILKTQGDLEQIKFNLNGHFRLAADINYNGGAFEPVKGQMTGSFDGAGHIIRNFTLDGKAMFSMVGTSGNPNASFIKDLTVRDVRASEVPAILVDDAYGISISNVHVMGVIAEGTNGDNYGTLVNNAAIGTIISECAVQADVNFPESDEVGGIVARLGNDSSIKAALFEGSVAGKSEVGGIAGSGFASASITDCHVNASIKAQNTVGGIMGSSPRTSITRCLVEGKLTATSPRLVWSDYAGGRVYTINAGGVAGLLSAPVVEYDDQGNPLPPDPTLPPVISNCVVALKSLKIPGGNASLKATAHRIVGYSSVNNDPAYLGEEYDETTQDWIITWGDPAAPEANIENNYVLEGLLPISSDVEDIHTSTEGQTISLGEADRDFFTDLGYGFDGNTIENPWVNDEDVLPALYFESTASQFMEFLPTTVSVVAGKSSTVKLRLVDVDIDSLTFLSTDEANCYGNPISVVNGGVEVEIIVNKSGVYTITATNGLVNASLLVTGTSGVESVDDDIVAMMTFDGRILNAEGCSIALYNLQGVEVSCGRDSISTDMLPAGVYVAVATDAAGHRSTLKISVR